MRPLSKVKIKWSSEFAYAVGLLTTDGNLSSDGRHISFTSKDEELVKLLRECLKIHNNIGKKARGYGKEKKYFVIQFGDVRFYGFLLSIGLTPRKSKTMGEIDIPDKYFFDFLRGHFDGDGTFYSYFDPRWKSSFMFYIELISASKKHIIWLQKRIVALSGVIGRITKSRNNAAYRLKYAKAESLKLLPRLYYNKSVICLSRKRVKIRKALRVAGKAL